VVLMVFKTIARVLRGFGGGFDSHTLPPTLETEGNLRFVRDQ